PVDRNTRADAALPRPLVVGGAIGAAGVRNQRLAFYPACARRPRYRAAVDGLHLRRPPRQFRHHRPVAISRAATAIHDRPRLRRAVYATAGGEFYADLGWASDLCVGYNPARTDGMTVYYAIGDVHGEKAKLDDLLTQMAREAAGAPHKIVFIGDLIDRGA